MESSITVSEALLQAIWKPFITDRMVMSAATPTHTPASDSQLLKETKNPASRERT